jgi:hypothetical protein
MLEAHARWFSIFKMVYVRADVTVVSEVMAYELVKINANESR